MPKYIDADALIRVLDAKADMAMGIPKEVFLSVAKMIDYLPTADVVPRAEVFEEVDKFRTNIMNKFIYLCRGNDYNKLTLLKIGDVVDEMYDVQIAELKKKYTEDQEQ
jgi:hypothetical protein